MLVSCNRFVHRVPRKPVRAVCVAVFICCLKEFDWVNDPKDTKHIVNILNGSEIETVTDITRAASFSPNSAILINGGSTRIASLSIHPVPSRESSPIQAGCYIIRRAIESQWIDLTLEEISSSSSNQSPVPRTCAIPHYVCYGKTPGTTKATSAMLHSQQNTVSYPTTVPI